MAPETAVYSSSNFVILKFYRKDYFSDRPTEACQGLRLLPLCDGTEMAYYVLMCR